MRGQSDYSGQTLDGRYLVERLLGEGGMGSVYEGRHVIVGRKVAIKFLHAELAGQEEVVKRFYREAQAAAAIRHKNIIDVLDVGLSPTGEPYMVMEYLEGESFSSLLKRAGRMDISAASGVLEPILLALKAAHEKGIVHRDLKPDNIFLAHNPDEPPTVKLIDFGISKFTRDPGASQLTMTGTAMGTPAYMSPEQSRGGREIDGRADLYAIGVVLYEALTGELPFSGESYNELLVNVLTAPPRPLRELLPEVPEDVERLVMRALSKSPGDRPQTAVEFLEALRSTRGFGERNNKLSLIVSTAKKRSFAGGYLGESKGPRGDSASIVFAKMKRDATPGTWAGTRGGDTKSRKPFVIAMTSFVVTAAAAFVGIFALLPKNESSAVAAPHPAPATPIQAVAQPPSPPEPAIEKPVAGKESVRISVVGAPEGAKVLFDGAEVPQNPFFVKRGDALVKLEVRAEGYVASSAMVSPSEDREVRIEMKRLEVRTSRHRSDRERTGGETGAAGAAGAKVKQGKHGAKFGTDFE